MEASILNATKKSLGLGPDYHAFDSDIVTYINSALASLSQLGVIASDGIAIEDSEATWEALGVSTNELSMVKTYVYLKARILFDPPATSYLIEAVNKQITEHEWRLSNNRETHKDMNYKPSTAVESEVI